MKPKILTFGEIIWDVYENGSFMAAQDLILPHTVQNAERKVFFFPPWDVTISAKEPWIL